MTCFHWVCKITVKYGSILYLCSCYTYVVVVNKERIKIIKLCISLLCSFPFVLSCEETKD